MAPMGEGGGTKIHMVHYVNGSSTHAQFLSLHNPPSEFFALLPQGGHKKNRNFKNVRFLWNRLYDEFNKPHQFDIAMINRPPYLFL